MSQKTLRQRLETVSTHREMIQNVVASLNLTQPGSVEFLRFCLAHTILFDAKMSDYGPGNMAMFGTITPTIRMCEKMERIKNLFKNKRKVAINESIRDSYEDISVLATIALMLDLGLWPKGEE